MLQCNNAPSSRTPRGHQTPAAFLIMASGLDKVGAGFKVVEAWGWGGGGVCSLRGVFAVRRVASLRCLECQLDKLTGKVDAS